MRQPVHHLPVLAGKAGGRVLLWLAGVPAHMRLRRVRRVPGRQLLHEGPRHRLRQPLPRRRPRPRCRRRRVHRHLQRVLRLRDLGQVQDQRQQQGALRHVQVQGDAVAAAARRGPRDQLQQQQQQRHVRVPGWRLWHGPAAGERPRLRARHVPGARFGGRRRHGGQLQAAHKGRVQVGVGTCR